VHQSLASRAKRAGAVDAESMLKSKDYRNSRENIMSVTANRLSDTEVQVEQTVYTFSDSTVADAFQRCVGDDSVDQCSTSHAPSSSRAANEDHPDDTPPGSVVSPSMGGMP
jgi:hypothetical protein